MTTAPERLLTSPPDYASGSLAAVLPAVARSLGSLRHAAAPDLGMPRSTRAVVVLVDGMGDDQLRRCAGHAPFLRAHLGSARRLDCGFPSTTATSMGSLGTGLPPGAHGLVGYEVLDPEAGQVFNELSWEHGPEPLRWQPYPTVFQDLVAEGVPVTRVGPGFFDGSGLTNAALRGGRFVAAASLPDRVAAAVAALRSQPRGLVYVYWGDLDKVGHVHGASSWEWVDELEAVDRCVGLLAAQVPADTAIHVTADHGMVDVPFADRVDLAHEPDLLQGVRHVAGEPRVTQLYTAPGAQAEVVARWRDRLGADAWVVTRAEAVAAGWFGAVRAHVAARIGDVLVTMLSQGAVVDSERMRPEALRLVGMHGSVSEEEQGIPLLTVPPRSA